MNLIGIPGDILFHASPLDSDLIAAEKQFRVIGNELAQLCDMCEAMIHLDDCQSVFDRTKAVLLSGKRGSAAFAKISGSLWICWIGMHTQMAMPRWKRHLRNMHSKAAAKIC